MSLKSLHLQDFLSYGRHCLPVELGSLNVIIGANGSGKSNFLDAIDLMRAAPCESDSSNTRAIIRNGGGAGEWIWKNAKDDSSACIEAVLDHPDCAPPSGGISPGLKAIRHGSRWGLLPLPYAGPYTTYRETIATDRIHSKIGQFGAGTDLSSYGISFSFQKERPQEWRRLFHLQAKGIHATHSSPSLLLPVSSKRSLIFWTGPGGRRAATPSDPVSVLLTQIMTSGISGDCTLGSVSYFTRV